MQLVAGFKTYAADCREMARSTSNPNKKRRLLEMATVWVLLAHEREALLAGRLFLRLDEQPQTPSALHDDQRRKLAGAFR
jgi:hypothetical protein